MACVWFPNLPLCNPGVLIQSQTLMKTETSHIRAKNPCSYKPPISTAQVSKATQKMLVFQGFNNQAEASRSHPELITITQIKSTLLCAVLSHSVVSNSLHPVDCSPPGSSVHGDSPGKNTGVDCHALLQGIFPTQESNPGLPHCRLILYHLSQQQSLFMSLLTFIKFLAERFLF